MSPANRHKKEQSQRKAFYTNHFLSEYSLMLKALPKAVFFNCRLMDILFFAPLKYVQGYAWIVMLIFSAALFSQLGCREYENNLTDYFITIRISLIKQLFYSYLWGTIILLVLSMPVIIRNRIAQNFLYSLSYMAFSIFIPALACFMGEYFKSRRTFETIYLLLCFILLNIPAFLFQGYIIILMTAGALFFIFGAFLRRLSL